ncbi:MAG: putative dehydrogenase transrane protein, partial [Rhodoferax sp.]|nr:putative dehydrogenase transrane protein [Rhodoferax sp.]
MHSASDVLIIGSGIGGATLAYGLVQRGVRVTMLERGVSLPREAQNWNVNEVFHNKRYVPQEEWLDKDGASFRPGNYYYVGGSSKLFGATMMRMREQDFEALAHEGGSSPAWPIRYADLAPYYDRAERLYQVHGRVGADPTAPPGMQAYPFPEMPSEPFIEKVAEALKDIGVCAFPIPAAIQNHQGGACIQCNTCDGFPCRINAKNDAEVAAIGPALATGLLELRTDCMVERLVLSADGRKVESVQYQEGGVKKSLSAPIVVLACSAVNSAALLLRSACPQAPNGVANTSDVVGRYYMAHNNTALMSIGWRVNPTSFQKTLSINDFYFGDADYPLPMGNIQLLGKLQSGMLTAGQKHVPPIVGTMMAQRSVDWWVMSEDLPDPENRVTLQAGRIKVSYTANNLGGHRQLVSRAVGMMKNIGFKLNIVKFMGGLSVSHQCGTVRFGTDPSSAALDPFCRSFDHRNLFVVDASFMPSSSAVNPALTIAAQALRVADHIATSDL